ncbi:MAG: 4-hydroxythreonine-4-phosphate dehydrogenase PdxA [Steroidobacteraceae bacterium]
MSSLPRIALTTGEPAGIGPDLALAIAEHDWPCQLVVLGDPGLLRSRALQLGYSLEFSEYQSGNTRPHQAGVVTYLPTPVDQSVQAGKLNKVNAGYVLSLLDRACDGCLHGEFAAMVTAPIQKSVINDADIAFTGHTEYLAERLGGVQPVMMLVANTLRVALATTHIPLAQVSTAITQAGLQHTLEVLHKELRSRFGIATPRIMVLGLNPHAGESGHLGREEIEIITPVINQYLEQGMSLIGPLPADTAFTPKHLQQVDAVLAMYHDQGLPVLKYAGFGNAVNVTLGLPIIRTSVDHGTALDLAGTGKADAGSLSAALKLAIEMSRAD